MRGIRYAFFDAGGTLVDIEYRHIREVMEAEGVPAAQVHDSDFERAEKGARAWFIGSLRSSGVPENAWREYFRRILTGVGAPSPRIASLLDRLWRRNAAAGLWHKPAPDAAATLERLRDRGLRLAVVSNAEGRVAEDLESAGLARYFEAIIDSGVVGVSKPDPRIFTIALGRLEASADESVYVGDIYRIDVEGARGAGMKAILLDRWGLQPEVDCPRIERLSDLDDSLSRIT